MMAGKALLGSDGGRVIVMSASGCLVGGGSLKPRDQVTLYNTNKESTLFKHTDQHEYYQRIGKSALKDRVTIDLVLGVKSESESIDLASLS